MSTWKAVVTEKGEALLAKMTQGSVMEITHAEIGAGQVDLSLLKQQTSVSTMKQTATIEPVGYPEEGMCALPVTITNEGVTAGYAAWQIGVFANDPDEGKILFFIAQAEDNATNIPSATLMPSYKTQIIFNVEYGAADSVTVDVNPANSVSQAGMENYVAGQIAGITADTLGLGNVDNTADTEKHVAFAQEAGEARQLQNSVTIRFNGGRTENTDMWTFDGSTDRTVNITPEKIGAAKSDHTHTLADLGAAAETHNHKKADITDFSHTHSASDVNSGTLSTERLPTVPVAKGGTGATTAAAALANLGAAEETHNHTKSDISDFSHTHSASEIDSGTLSSERLPTIPISKGGTGATDGATALKNLLAAGVTVLSSYQYGTTLPAAGTPGRIFFKKV